MSNHSYFQGKLAFITGASEGIGLATAKDLFASGANVVIFSRSEEKLVKAKKEIEAKRAKPEQKIQAVSLDVTNHAATQIALTDAVKKFGVPDYLINCAGFAQPGYLNDIDIKAYREMMDLNYFGLVHTTRAIVPFMIEAKRGHIINTSSMAGFLGLFGYSGYCASKYAAIGFSQALRHELKPYGIKVSVLCPPNTRTPGLDRENLTKPSEVLKLEEKAKVVNPEEVSEALLRAIAKNKFMIVPTFDGSSAYYLSRFLPAVIDQFIKRPPATAQKI